MPDRMHRHISYGNVVATAALFIALGGVSYAAIKLPAGSVGTKQLKNGAVTAKKINKKTRARLSRRGPAGAKGAQGDRGLPGADGATGAALLTGVGGDLQMGTPNGTDLSQVAVNGQSSATSPLARVASLSPNRRLRVRDMAATVVNDVPNGSSVTIDLMSNPAGDFGSNTGPPLLGCTITGTSGPNDLSCTAAGPATLEAGRVIFMRITKANGGTPSDPNAVHWGIAVEPAP